MAEPVIQRVLVIDEDANLRNFYAHLLTAQGHEVVTAADTTEADYILDSESEPFNLVIVDIPTLGHTYDYLGELRRKHGQAALLGIAGNETDREMLKDLRRHCHDTVIRTQFEIAVFTEKANFLLAPDESPDSRLRPPKIRRDAQTEVMD